MFRAYEIIDQPIDCTYSGALVAATGTFEGDLTAAGGTFQGTVAAGAVIATGTVEAEDFDLTEGGAITLRPDASFGFGEIRWKDSSGNIFAGLDGNTSTEAVNLHATNVLLTGTQVEITGAVTIDGSLNLELTTSDFGGTTAGYIVVNINGVQKKIAYHNNS